MLESLRSLATNIINLFNRSKFTISCCMTQTTVKISSPKRMRTAKRRKTI